MKVIQQSYTLQPLSAFLATPAPAAAPAVQWPVWTDGDETKEAYWSYVSFLLPFITPHPDDAPIYEKLASIGIKRGAPWQPEKLDPAVKAPLQQGIDAARAEMKTLSEAGVDAAKFFGTREGVSTNYMDRAMGVYMGIFGNVPKVSVDLVDADRRNWPATRWQQSGLYADVCQGAAAAGELPSGRSRCTAFLSACS